jgi:hypothetical protein
MLEYSLDVITYDWLESTNGYFLFVFLAIKCGKILALKLLLQNDELVALQL